MDIGQDLIGADWEVYRNLMADAHATFAQKIMIWNRKNTTIHRYGEDSSNATIDTPLKVLCNWNHFRTWPTAMVTESGTDDEQNVQVLINKDFLRVNDLLDAHGYMRIDPAMDRFFIDNIEYKSLGDTPLSQMKMDDVHIALLLKRNTPNTGANR